MKTLIHRITPLLFLSIVLLQFGGCQPVEKKRDGILKIVTTTGMIYDAVINIGQDRVSAQALMGPGVDPHLYKATQGDLSKLQSADLILYNGIHLEGKMGDVFKKLGRIKAVHAVADDIPVADLRTSEFFKDTHDPHIWFDVALWKNAVKSASLKMIELDSVNMDFYKKNTATYLSRLDSLHAAVISSISSIPKSQRILITAHDAFGYFGDAYDIEVKGLQGISTLSEPGLKDVTNLVDLITSNNIKAVFIETSVSQKAINAVVEGCHQKGHDVKIGGSLYSDAMGAFNTPEGTYIGMVNANVQLIVNALR